MKKLPEFSNALANRTSDKKYDISLDPIYTSKLVYGVLNLITNNFFKPNSKILMIHTGGHQGILPMNKYLKDKNLTTINYK